MKTLALSMLKNNFRTIFWGSVLIIAAICGWYGFQGVYQSGINYPAITRTEYSNKIETLNTETAEYFKENGGTGKSAEARESIDRQAEYLEKMIRANAEGDWAAELELAIKQASAEKALMKDGVLPDQSSIDSIIAVDTYLLDNQIRPQNPPEACNGFNSLKLFCEQLLFLVVSVCPLLFSALSAQNERRSGAYKLVLQQPFSRTKILISKFLTVFVYSVFTAAAAGLLIFVLCAVFFGTGDFRYPVLNLSGEIMQTGELIAGCMLAAPFICAFFSGLGILLTVCVKSEVLCTVCSIGIPAILLVAQGIASGTVFVIPFLSANTYLLLTKSHVGLVPALGLHLLFSSIFLVLGGRVFKNKDQS